MTRPTVTRPMALPALDPSTVPARIGSRYPSPAGHELFDQDGEPYPRPGPHVAGQ